ncbi:Uncharacterized protein dnm_020240 [Desulfonema magnum]|uniref:Uncharacterized protein n=1 Tax=Desulfonema magnum TaxID=45655 RepID=A0A975GLM8_9BACT|nr:Uncharacterized protein dnm_020240 [Desulfonema magnum]
MPNSGGRTSPEKQNYPRVILLSTGYSSPQKTLSSDIYF